MRAIDGAMQGRTTFIVARRISTLRRADRVMVLERGRIVEAGTHDELVRGRGPYRHGHLPAKGPVPQLFAAPAPERREHSGRQQGGGGELVGIDRPAGNGLPPCGRDCRTRRGGSGPSPTGDSRLCRGRPRRPD